MSPNPARPIDESCHGVWPSQIAYKKRVLYKRKHFLGHDDLKFVAQP
jgi:hypothetical protein